MEALVFRRSERGGEAASGFLLELFRDNHENGPVSFLVGAGEGSGFSGAGGVGGGGANLTGDIRPERPCGVESRLSRGGNLGSRLGAFAPSATSQLSDHLIMKLNHVQGASTTKVGLQCDGHNGEVTVRMPAIVCPIERTLI